MSALQVVRNTFCAFAEDAGLPPSDLLKRPAEAGRDDLAVLATDV